MLNIFRSQRSKSVDSQVLLWFGIPPTITGGFMTMLGVWMLLSGQAIADTFWTAMVISVTILVCGVGALAYRWHLDRKSSDAGESL